MLNAILHGLRLPRRGLCQENVTGPVKGYAIAAYAVPAGEGGWRSFYKVCNGPSSSYWEALCLVKGSLEGPYVSSAAAMRAAETAAADDIANLPPLSQLAAGRERRGFYLYEWAELRSGRMDSDQGASPTFSGQTMSPGAALLER